MRIKVQDDRKSFQLRQVSFSSSNQKTSELTKWVFTLPRHNVMPQLVITYLVMTYYLKGWLCRSKEYCFLKVKKKKKSWKGRRGEKEKEKEK